MSAIGRAAGRGWAATLALVAVLMLLAVPALEGRAHAAMPSMDMATSMPMTGVEMPMPSPAQAASSVPREAGKAICVTACSLAGQLLALPFQAVVPQRRAGGPVRYFIDAPRPGGLSGAPGSPPPR